MKRQIIGVLFLVSLLLFAMSPAWAETPIRIIINGQEVAADVPPRLINSRVLVPIRVISEYLGAVVLWEQKGKTVTVKLGDSEIRLPVGQPKALANGGEIALDVPAQLINNRVLVPLRFIGEAFGAELRWDNASKTVTVDSRPATLTSIERVAGEKGPELLLTADKPFSFEVLKTDDPLNVQILLRRVSGEKLPSPADWAEYGMELLEFVPSADGQDVILHVNLQAPKKVAVQTVAPNQMAVRLTYDVTNIEYERARNGERVSVFFNGPVPYEVNEKRDENQVVLALKPATLGSFTPPVVKKGGVVKEIAAHPVEEDGVEVVLSIAPNAKYAVQEREGSLTLDFWFAPQLSDIRFESSPISTRFTIEGTGDLTPQISVLKNPTRLVLDFPSMTVGVVPPEIPVHDGTVIRVRTAQNSVNPDIVRVVLDLPYFFGHRVAESDEPGVFRLEVMASPLADKVIVVDPGHGGSDPGAIGKTGLKEKEPNLAIALKLADLLKAGGAKVYLTRSDDRDVSLDSRVQLANDLPADFFISIHQNSAESATASGTETLYFPGSPEGKMLAAAIQKELVAALQLPDRGIIPRPGLFVLNKTVMPGVLVETAFVSNPAEAQQISQESFRHKVAQAIFQGLTNYLRDNYGFR